MWQNQTVVILKDYFYQVKIYCITTVAQRSVETQNLNNRKNRDLIQVSQLMSREGVKTYLHIFYIKFLSASSPVGVHCLHSGGFTTD